MKDIIYTTAAFRPVNIPLLEIKDQMNFMNTIITFYLSFSDPIVYLELLVCAFSKSINFGLNRLFN